MDAYFTALDTDAFDAVRPALSEGVRFRSSAGDTEGVDEFREYLEEQRMVEDSLHEITRQIHHSDASVCEGLVSGETPDGRVEGAFCDVFEFAPDDELITSISVYTRL